MPSDLTADKFVKELRSYRSSKQRATKTDDGDQFMDVPMRDVFSLAKQFMDMPPGEIEKLLESPIHEVRAGAVSIMDWQARSKKTPDSRRKELFDLYIRRHDRIAWRPRLYHDPGRHLHERGVITPAR